MVTIGAHINTTIHRGEVSTNAASLFSVLETLLVYLDDAESLAGAWGSVCVCGALISVALYVARSRGILGVDSLVFVARSKPLLCAVLYTICCLSAFVPLPPSAIRVLAAQNFPVEAAQSGIVLAVTIFAVLGEAAIPSTDFSSFLTQGFYAGCTLAVIAAAPSSIAAQACRVSLLLRTGAYWANVSGSYTTLQRLSEVLDAVLWCGFALKAKKAALLDNSLHSAADAPSYTPSTGVSGAVVSSAHEAGLLRTAVLVSLLRVCVALYRLYGAVGVQAHAPTGAQGDGAAAAAAAAAAAGGGGSSKSKAGAGGGESGASAGAGLVWKKTSSSNVQNSRRVVGQLVKHQPHDEVLDLD